MRIIADTHLHLYPCYSLERVFARLMSVSEEFDVLLGFLAERHDCDFHGRLLRGEIAVKSPFHVAPAGDGLAVAITRVPHPAPGFHCPESRTLHLLPGRQLVTSERLEILALATTAMIPDGLPAIEAVDRTLECGGVAVLAWAPGKWLFRRAPVVRALLDNFGPGSLLIGDSSLRPTVWGTPLPMRSASRRGFKVVAGSDPLPFKGEEEKPGTYTSLFEGEFDSATPLQSARDLLTGQVQPVTVGRRDGPLQVMRRIRMNAQA